MERVGKKNERISKEEALGWGGDCPKDAGLRGGRLSKGRWAEGWAIVQRTLG